MQRVEAQSRGTLVILYTNQPQHHSRKPSMELVRSKRNSPQMCLEMPQIADNTTNADWPVSHQASTYLPVLGGTKIVLTK